MSSHAQTVLRPAALAAYIASSAWLVSRRVEGGILRVRRNAAAHGDHGQARVAAQLYQAADALGHGLGLRFARAGEHDRELLATDPARHVKRSHCSGDALGHRGQHVVADEVAVLVVDALEVVEVGDQQADALPGALCSSQLRAEGADELPLVVQPREAVVSGQPGKTPVGAVQGEPSHAVGEAANAEAGDDAGRAESALLARVHGDQGPHKVGKCEADARAESDHDGEDPAHRHITAAETLREGFCQGAKGVDATGLAGPRPR